MLRRHYGSTKFGDIALRLRSRNMAPFAGTTDLAMRAMRAMRMTFAAFGKVQPVQPIGPSTQIIPKTWNHNYGIKFHTGLARSLTPAQSMHTSAIAAHDQALSDHSDTEDAYVMSTPLSCASSETSGFIAPSISSSDNNGGPSSKVVPTAPDEQNMHAPLQFKIPFEILDEMRSAEPSDLYWSYALYRGPEGADHKVKVHYCRSKHTSERVAQYFVDKDVLGFDIEWNPDAWRLSGARQNVSLIQIASDDRIALFHISLFAKDDIDDLVPPTLKRIMENPGITKAGVAIKGDCTRLRKHLGIDAKGVFELSHLYKLVKFSESGEYEKINKRLVNLASQVEEHLELPLFKGEVRESDWTQKLNIEQLSYAASDSYAGLRLFDKLEEKRKALKPSPPRPYFSELDRPIRLAEGVAQQSLSEHEEELEPPCSTTKGSMKVDDTSIEIEQEGVSNSGTSTRTRAKSAKKDKSLEIITAENWVIEWKASKAPTYTAKATNPSLRAYALWQYQDMSVDAIAKLLEIQKTTVVTYVLEAVKAERLPFTSEKLSKVLAYLPESVTTKRYRTLVSSVRKSTGPTEPTESKDSTES